MWRSSFLVNLQACRLIAGNFTIKWTPSQVFFDNILSSPLMYSLCTNYALFCNSLINFNEGFFDWPSIVLHSPAGLMYIMCGSVVLVHRNIQVTAITLPLPSVTFSYVRALSVSMWKKSWFKCIILTKVFWLKSITIVTECISDHNDTNKHNNCLSLICTLNGSIRSNKRVI